MNVSLESTMPHKAALTRILQETASAGAMEIDAPKEIRLLHTDGVRRFAVVSSGGGCVGYITGSFRAGRDASGLAVDGVVAFISLLIVDPSSQGQGIGRAAVERFVALAWAETGAASVGVRLDEVGDLAGRTEFETLGFEFDGLDGIAKIAEILD